MILITCNQLTINSEVCAIRSQIDFETRTSCRVYLGYKEIVDFPTFAFAHNPILQEWESLKDTSTYTGFSSIIMARGQLQSYQ